MIQRVYAWLEAVGSQYGIDQAYLFGSVICSYRFTEHLDVDVAIASLSSDDYFQAIGQLSEWVERPVDLVDLTRCPFADRIRQRGVLWTRQA